MAPLYRTERSFPSVILKWLHRQFCHNLNSAAELHYRECYTGPSEHFAVTLWPRGGHPTETDQRCGVISLLTALTGNPPLRPTVNTAHTLRLYCVFCNCMQYRAACDVFIAENTESCETSWFSVKVTAVPLVNTAVLDLGMGLDLSKSNATFVYTVLHIHKYKNRL